MRLNYLCFELTIFCDPFLFSTTMSSVDFFAQDKIWFEKPRYDEAERRFYEKQPGPSEETQVPTVQYGPSQRPTLPAIVYCAL